jgi:hypothetical protein
MLRVKVPGFSGLRFLGPLGILRAGRVLLTTADKKLTQFAPKKLFGSSDLSLRSQNFSFYWKQKELLLDKKSTKKHEDFFGFFSPYGYLG